MLAYNDKRFNRAVDIKTGFKTRTILCMPMKNGKGDIIGVAQMINELPESFTFTKEDEGLVNAFASLCNVFFSRSNYERLINSDIYF